MARSRRCSLRNRPGSKVRVILRSSWAMLATAKEVECLEQPGSARVQVLKTSKSEYTVKGIAFSTGKFRV